MAYDFPTNPPPGQVYTQGGVTYEWNGYAWIKGSGSTVGAPTDYVLKAGDTMLGFLTANADPTAPLHYATKQYVDVATMPTPVGNDGEALVALGGLAVWAAPINGGIY
jgi:hypothetical protein